MATPCIKCLCFTVILLQLTAIGLLNFSIWTSQWTTLDGLESSLLDCTSNCNGLRSLKDFANFFCTVYTAYPELCTGFDRLYTGGLIFLITAATTLSFRYCWVISTILIYSGPNRKRFLCGIIVGIMAILIESAGFATYMIYTNTNFSGCGNAANFVNELNFCAGTGVYITIADISLVGFVFLIFLLFASCSISRSKILATRNAAENISNNGIGNSKFKIQG